MRLRYWELSCDYNLSPDCWESSSTERTSTDLTREARKAGWRIGPANGEEDACPECRKAIIVEGHDEGDTFIAERLVGVGPG